MAEESILKLHADVAWILALVWIAKAGRSGEPQPQVHYYLGDRIGAYPRDIERGVRSEERVSSEQKRSAISAQVDGILYRQLRRWPCRFQSGRHSLKPSVGTFGRAHPMTQLEDDKMLSNPRLKADVENARLSGSLFATA